MNISRLAMLQRSHDFIVEEVDFNHTRGTERVYVLFVEGECPEELGRFFLTRIAVEMALVEASTPTPHRRELEIRGKSYEEMLAFFERHPSYKHV